MYSQYLQMRFDRRLRLFGSVLFTTLSALWMPISIYVPALTFNQVTGIDMHIITPIVCVICIFYTCIGGIKGVIWTDVLQGIIMVMAMLIVIIKGTREVGGLGVVMDRNWISGRLEAPTFTFDPTVRMGFFAVFVGGALFKLQVICINQSTVQRYLTLPKLSDVRRCVIWSMLGFIFVLGLCIYLGLLTYAAHYDCDPISTQLAHAKDQVVPLYVMEVAGEYPGISGMFVSGVFSAALSSLSTVLNALSGVVLTDFVVPYRKKPLTERQTRYILRSVVVVFGLLSMCMVRIVEHLGLVMQLSATVGSMTAGPLLGIFTAGMVMPFINANSILTGCTTAFGLMGYIVVRAQLAIAAGELNSPTKPVSTEGCTYSFTPANVTEIDHDVEAISKGIHHISFLWYTAVGAITTIIVALLATLVFGRQDVSQVPPELVIPLLRRYTKPPKEYMLVEKPPKQNGNAGEEESLSDDCTGDYEKDGVK